MSCNNAYSDKEFEYAKQKADEFVLEILKNSQVSVFTQQVLKSICPHFMLLRSKIFSSGVDFESFKIDDPMYEKLSIQNSTNNSQSAKSLFDFFNIQSLNRLDEIYDMLVEFESELYEIREFFDNYFSDLGINFDDEYGKVIPEEYRELKESLEELERQRDELEEELEEAEDDENSELNEKLKEIDYKIKVVEDQMESFGDEDDGENEKFYPRFDDLIERMELSYLCERCSLEHNANEVVWNLDDILQIIEEFQMKLEEPVSFIKSELHPNVLVDADQIVELISSNDEAFERLSRLLDVQILRNYENTDSLMSYLKKNEKKNILNI